MDPVVFEEIDALLAGELDDQEAADALVDRIEEVAAESAELAAVIARYGERVHAPLQRVLAFVVSRHATALEGPRRNLIYRLVPAICRSGDASALTNAMTAVQRMAMLAAPWHPEGAPPPPELVELLLTALAGERRNQVDALQLLERLAEDGVLASFAEVDRRRLAEALVPLEAHANSERLRLVRAAL